MCEPLLTHRNETTMASKPGSVGGPGIKARHGGPSVGELPVCGPDGARCIGGVSSSQALARNRRTCRPDRDGRCFLAARGRTTSSEHCEWESTDAGHRGGPARSSGEGPVMGSERRGRAVHGRLEVNPSGEEPTDRPRQKNAGLWEPYDGRLSRTVLREREGEVPSRYSPGSRANSDWDDHAHRIPPLEAVTSYAPERAKRRGLAELPPKVCPHLLAYSSSAVRLLELVLSGHARGVRRPDPLMECRGGRLKGESSIC